MQGNRTLLILYPGCIPFEAMMAAELLGEVHPVDVATADGDDLKAANGIVFRAQMSFQDVKSDTYRCVLVPGGDPSEVLENQALGLVLQQSLASGAVLGAICAGPLLLAKWGLLRGRRFTHGYGDHHREFLAPYWEGAEFVDSPLVIDGPIVTAQPQAHIDFGVEVARMVGIVSADRCEQVKAYYKGLPTPVSIDA